jgi:N-acetylglucosaminyldiphosphoundecaprenol N-acetyl-beta-D-mannosaminyltransferase
MFLKGEEPQMLSQPQSSRRSSVTLFGIPIHALTAAEAVRWVDESVRNKLGMPIRVSAVNAHFFNVASRQSRLHWILAANDLNLADGVSVCLAARILGVNLPERIPGIDFMVHLCRLAAATGRSVYFLGGREGAAERAALRLAREIPGLKIEWDRPPFSREFDPEVVRAVRARIEAAHPDFLFVCMGVPRQEFWIQEHALDLPVKLVMGNGAAFDVLAGDFQRPARWIQNIGMEWFYRLCVEPRRLARRYTLGNLRFLNLVVQQLFHQSMRTSAQTHA